MRIIRLLLSALTLLTTLPTAAQDELEANVQVDFVSKYMWRGQELGHISIQPMAGLSWRGLGFSVSGSTGLDKDDSDEIDVTLGYEYSGFNVGLTDYWTSGQDYDGRDRYFFFDKAESAHQLEANIGYSCQWFSLQAYTFVWGNDFKYDTYRDSKYRVNGKRAFSTYIELGIPFYMAGLDWDIKAGVTPFKSACTRDIREDSTYYYADKLAFVMASARATKNFELGDMKVPVFAEFHANPYTQKAFFLVGISVIPFK